MVLNAEAVGVICQRVPRLLVRVAGVAEELRAVPEGLLNSLLRYPAVALITLYKLSHWFPDQNQTESGNKICTRCCFHCHCLAC